MTRAMVVWCGLLILAVLNGAVRVGWLIPRVGEHVGHLLSTISLSGLILLTTWATADWLGLTTVRRALATGLLWVALTIGFEFLAGHYVFGAPWPQLTADYDLTAGRIWVLVLITTTMAPLFALRVRGG